MADKDTEDIDTLAPPTFEPTGTVKQLSRAIQDGDWVGSINVWLYTRSPEPSIIYQLRSPNKSWEPNKLDVAVGGRYNAGERGLDGLRELREELGIDIPRSDCQYFSRKLNVSRDVHGNENRWLMTIYLAEYKGDIQDMVPQEDEVYGVFQVPIRPLLDVFQGRLESFDVTGIDAHKQPLNYTVTADSFPYNFDDYQQQMAKFIALKLGVDDAYLGN